MLNVLKTTAVGMGHGMQPDAFQRGRESGQTALSQITDPIIDLVLALAPSDDHFQGFIEGVRLVTGEESLVGIPSKFVFTNDLFLPDAGLVAVIQSNTIHFSTAHCALSKENVLHGTTSLLSQFRSSRGNLRAQFGYHGLLTFANSPAQNLPLQLGHLAAEIGLDSWLVNIVPPNEKPMPLMCNDSALDHGLVGIEMLSHSPIGLGSVSIDSFNGQPQIYSQAIKSAVREAASQMDEEQPALALLLFDFVLDTSAWTDLRMLFRTDPLLNNLPILGMYCDQHSVTQPNRAIFSAKNSVTAMLLPL